MIGLELKREMLEGELSSFDKMILPGVAAVGGMVVPALVYVSLNYSYPENMSGWAIPTATDIAFSLAVLLIIGKKVPITLKIFLLSLAIIDDLGAVLIIALFYTAEIQGTYLICCYNHVSSHYYKHIWKSKAFLLPLSQVYSYGILFSSLEFMQRLLESYLQQLYRMLKIMKWNLLCFKSLSIVCIIL